MVLDRLARRNRLLAGAVGLLILVGPGLAGAATLKSVMTEMAGTTKAAKLALGSGDVAQAEAVLARYAAEARAAGASVGGSDVKAQDLRRRFSALTATAAGARPAAFKAAFGSIVGQCRSCHAVYQ